MARSAAFAEAFARGCAAFGSRIPLLAGLALAALAAGCAHQPAGLLSRIGDEGAFGSSTARLGPLAWTRMRSHLPGPVRSIDWQPVASAGRVQVYAAPGAPATVDADRLARDIQAGVHYLYPAGGRAAPVRRIAVHLVPPGIGANERRTSIGRPGQLEVAFHLRQPTVADARSLGAYGAGTVAHELVHVQRRLDGVPIDDAEEFVASMLEACAVLAVFGEVSPGFSPLAFERTGSRADAGLAASARGAADLARSLPPVVQRESQEGAALLARCGEHFPAAGPMGDGA